MQANKSIVIGGLIIITVGAVNAAMKSRPETPVFVGCVGVILLASILDTFGPGWSRIATGFVWLAAITVLIVEGPGLFQALQNAQAHKGA